MLNELEEKSVQQIDLAWIPRLRLSHGLRTPNEACFHRNPKLLFVIGQTDWTDEFWGIWGIFGQIISTHFSTFISLSILSIISTKISF